MRIIPLSIFSLVVMAGCTTMEAPAGSADVHAEAAAAVPGPLPASFSGEIPCADCPGIIFRLNLFPDQVFFESMTYLERDVVYYDIGRWSARGESGIIELEG